LNQLNRRTFLSVSSSLFALPVLAQLSGCSEEQQPRSSSKSFVEPKFELLDIALQHEFGAVVQYGNHAGLAAASGKDTSGSIGRIIREIIAQEVHHAIYLTEILKKNGFEPTVAVWPPQTAATPEKMMEKDIAAEKGAITLYQQILEQDFDDQTKKNMEEFLQAEMVHQQMFARILSELVC
jgi:rubrerythrin